MNQNYSQRFNEMLESDPTKQTQAQEGKNELFPSGSNTRNLCFVWPDGKKKFLNYAYLVTGEYSPDDSLITLVFTSDTIVLKGVKLGDLFEKLTAHEPKTITCIEERYNATQDEKEGIVNEIVVTKNEK